MKENTTIEMEYDKCKWEKGELDNEPNRIEFEHSGYDCMAIRNHESPTGYVDPWDNPCVLEEIEKCFLKIH